jgi:YD repeat-containing protein
VLLGTLALGSVLAAEASAAAPQPLRAAAGEHEIASLRTATSRTYQRDDGTHRVVVSAAPVHARRNGKWAAIDTDLIRAGSTFIPVTTGHQLVLPESAGGETVLRSGNARLSFRTLGLAGRGKARRDTASYRELDGTQLKLQATPDGVKESLIFADAEAVRTVRYRLSWAGVTPERRGDAWVMVANGRVVFTLNPMFLVDEARVPHVSPPLPVDLRVESGGGTMTVKPDLEFLARSDLEGPITLDPTVVVSGVQQECTAESVHTIPGNQWSHSMTCGGPLRAGVAQTTYDPGGRDSDCAPMLESVTTSRPLIRFDVSGLSPRTQVLNAELVTHGATVRAAEGPAAWNGEAASSWLEPLGDGYFESGALHNNVTYRFLSARQIVQGWIEGAPNRGFALIGDESTAGEEDCFVDAFDHRALVSGATDADPSRRPYLMLTLVPDTGARPEYPLDRHEITPATTAQVNMATGNLILRRLAHEPSIDWGPRIGLGESFNSKSDAAGAFGARWTFDAAEDVKVLTFRGGTGLGLHQPTGIVARIPGSFLPGTTLDATAEGLYEEPKWLEGTMTHQEGAWPPAGYTFRSRADGLVQQFDGAGRLLSRTDGNGDGAAFSYDVNGRVTLIRYSHDRYLGVTRSGAKITGFYEAEDASGAPAAGGLAWSYAYDSEGRLHSATDTTGTTTYGYDSAGRVDHVSAPGGAQASITYDGAGRVSKLTTTAGGTTRSTTYAYSTGKTVATPSSGSSASYYFDRKDKLYAPDTASPWLTLLPAATYSNGVAPWTVTVAARDDRSGVKRVDVARSGAGATVSIPGEGCLDAPSIAGWESSSGVSWDCDRILTVTHEIPTVTLPQGVNPMTFQAYDGGGNASTVSHLDLLVDRTAPPAPTDLLVEGLDNSNQTALVSWSVGDDPEIALDVPGSGVDRSEIRFQIDGMWSDWVRTDGDDYVLSGVDDGDTVAVDVRSIDEVGNVSPTVSQTMSIAQPSDTDDQDGPTAGTGDTTVTIKVRSDDGEGGTDPVTGHYVVLSDDEDDVTVRTDGDGDAVFEGVEAGTHTYKLLTRDTTYDVSVPGSGSIERTITIDSEAGLQALTESADPLPADYRAFCATGKYREISVAAPGLLACRHWDADADLAEYLDNRLYETRGGPRAHDDTRANALRHMMWNALMVASVFQSNLIVNDDNHYNAAKTFSVDVYEYQARRDRDPDIRRGSTMDRHNNRLGWGYMRRRTPDEIGSTVPDFGVCKRIRHLVGSARKAVFISGESDVLRQPVNDFRPLFIRDLDDTGFKVFLRRVTPIFDPCGPLKPGRRARN